MTLLPQLKLFAEYNRAMNRRLYENAAALSAAEIAADRGAFFKSILGTLNHLVVADVVWLKRFAMHPAAYTALAPMHDVEQPTALSQIVHGDLAELDARRRALDDMIVDWIGAVREGDLDQVLAYRTMRGEAQRKAFGLLLAHFFNHQTHHRGQATTLFSQAGVDVGVTDLMVWIPDAAD